MLKAHEHNQDNPAAAAAVVVASVEVKRKERIGGWVEDTRYCYTADSFAAPGCLYTQE